MASHRKEAPANIARFRSVKAFHYDLLHQAAAAVPYWPLRPTYNAPGGCVNRVVKTRRIHKPVQLGETSDLSKPLPF
jgi:hypothetical protein